MQIFIRYYEDGDHFPPLLPDIDRRVLVILIMRPPGLSTSLLVFLIRSGFSLKNDGSLENDGPFSPLHTCRRRTSRACTTTLNYIFPTLKLLNTVRTELQYHHYYTGLSYNCDPVMYAFCWSRIYYTLLLHLYYWTLPVLKPLVLLWIEQQQYL